MKLEHYSGEKLKKDVLDVIGKYIDLRKYRVFFFGSRVSGKADERSDIDLGIEGSDPIRASDMLDIQEEIENIPILYKIEVVDFSEVSKKFKEVAKQDREMLN